MANTNVQSINRWQLGIILKDARIRAGIAQAEAAGKLGYSVPFLSQLERGRIAVPMAGIPAIVSLYSQGEPAEDAKLILCILYLSNTNQWKVLSPVLALVLGKDLDILCTGVQHTVKLRLKECGVDI